MEEELATGGDPLNVPYLEEWSHSQIDTTESICEMEGKEIFLFAELHPHYANNCYHSPLTLC